MLGEHLKLDLGSGNEEEGEFHPKGFILQDIQPHKGIDLVCDILDLEKYIKKGQCKYIRACHILEHFSTNQILNILSILYRLLEKGGILEVHVPNFRWHAQLLDFNRDEEAVKYCFGGQKDQYDFHKTGFTPNILVLRLTEAGFTVEHLEEEYSLHVIAMK